MLSKLIIMLSMIFLCFSLNGCAGCGKGYSEGEQIGTLVKFSHKGLFIKSWEGSLNLGGTVSSNNGVVPSTWDFTVVDEKLVPVVQKALELNKKVKCTYIQWFASPIRMDSDYELTSIEIIE